MKKLKKLLTILLAMSLLIGCASKEVVDSTSKSQDKVIEKLSEPLKALPDLDSKEGIIEYLVGDWVYNYYYRDDVIAKMSIDKDLNVDLSIINTYSKKPNGKYKGKISFDWAYVDNDQAPDMILLNLNDDKLNGGEFLFLHRTIYDGKRVMSWFYFGNSNSIFDVEDPDGEYLEAQPEIMFEQITNEKTSSLIHKNKGFHGVIWAVGSDKKSLWIDDVLWHGLDEAYTQDYPYRMAMYQNDVTESVLYKVNEKEIAEVLGDEMPLGEVYFIETNDDGEITFIIDANRKDWMEAFDKDNDEIEGRIIDVLYEYEEVVKYLNLGMTALFENDYTYINEREFYKVVLGTHHEDGYFVRELYYAVDIDTKEVYEYDVISDQWIELGKG